MHLNGFIELRGSYGGLERHFDLGYKFEERESDEFRINPNTGVKAFAEPLLALDVSAARRGSVQVPVTLQYAKTRSSFSRGLHATNEDRDQLLKAAAPRIAADLQILLDAGNPDSVRRRRFL